MIVRLSCVLMQMEFFHFFHFESKKFLAEEMTDQPWFKDAMNSEGVTDEMLSESY